MILCSFTYLISSLTFSYFFFFNDPATTEIYTLSLHDALPISSPPRGSPTATLRAPAGTARAGRLTPASRARSGEHTSELQSRLQLLCPPFPEKKKKEEQYN